MTSNEIKHLIVVLDGANLASVGDDRIRETISHAVVEGVGSSNELIVRLVRDLLLARLEATECREALGLQPDACVKATVETLVEEHQDLGAGVLMMWSSLSEARLAGLAGEVWQGATTAIRRTGAARLIACHRREPEEVGDMRTSTQDEAALMVEHHALIDGVMTMWRALSVIGHGAGSPSDRAKVAIRYSAPARAIASAATGEGIEEYSDPSAPMAQVDKLEAIVAAYDDGDQPETYTSGWHSGRHALAQELLGRPPCPAEGNWVWSPDHGGAWLPDEADEVATNDDPSDSGPAGIRGSDGPPRDDSRRPGGPGRIPGMGARGGAHER